jgi:hypothetical protein
VEPTRARIHRATIELDVSDDTGGAHDIVRFPVVLNLALEVQVRLLWQAEAKTTRRFAMKSTIPNELRAIADRMDANAALDNPVLPANWVRIHTPFPRGRPYRDYPDPQFVLGADGRRVDTLTAYATAAQDVWLCPHFDAKRDRELLTDVGNYNNSLIARDGIAAYPKILDRLSFPNDYLDPSYVPNPVAGFSPGVIAQ